MLVKDPENRITVCDLLDDTWLTNNGSEPIDLFIATQTEKSSINVSQISGENYDDNAFLEDLSERLSE